MEPLKYVALEVLRNCGGKLKYWKLVAKLATDFMSVRISMLSVFKLNKLFSVLEISFILNYPHICAFLLQLRILSLLIQKKQISPENIFTKNLHI